MLKVSTNKGRNRKEKKKVAGLYITPTYPRILKRKGTEKRKKKRERNGRRYNQTSPWTGGKGELKGKGGSCQFFFSSYSVRPCEEKTKKKEAGDSEDAFFLQLLGGGSSHRRWGKKESKGKKRREGSAIYYVLSPSCTARSGTVEGGGEKKNSRREGGKKLKEGGEEKGGGHVPSLRSHSTQGHTKGPEKKKGGAGAMLVCGRLPLPTEAGVKRGIEKKKKILSHCSLSSLRGRLRQDPMWRKRERKEGKGGEKGHRCAVGSLRVFALLPFLAQLSRGVGKGCGKKRDVGVLFPVLFTYLGGGEKGGRFKRRGRAPCILLIPFFLLRRGGRGRPALCTISALKLLRKKP